jgi:hypothetical protein
MGTDHCPTCGRPRRLEDRFCSVCGVRFAPPVPDVRMRPLSEAAERRASAGGSGLVVAAALVFTVGVFIFALATGGMARSFPLALPSLFGPPAIACDQGEQLVYQRHTMLFGLMSAQLGTQPQYYCQSPRSDGVRPITIFWSSGGKTYGGTYDVSASGVVTVGDDAAARLDQVAATGATVLNFLR